VDALARLDSAVAEATWLLDDPGTKVGDVAASVYVSERQLRRRFEERVGYGPKTLQRVLRFQRLKAMLEVPGAELARAAVAAGYADQAHLSRECRELAGLTPSELAAWLR
jgi:transcriptional regulator GlxA family with amidase domain